MKARFYVPSIEEYQGMSLEDVEEFKEFLACDAFYVNVHEVNGKLEEINFKWNPYGNDYAPTVTVKPGEVFMYNTDDKDDYKVIRNIPDWWVVRGEE